MNFIRRIGRDEIYIKYVHQLVNVRSHGVSVAYSLNSAIDASTVAELRGSRAYLETSFRPPRMGSQLVRFPDGGFRIAAAIPISQERDTMFAYIGLSWYWSFSLPALAHCPSGKGKAWENAIEICRELAFQHSEVTFN